MQQADSGLVRLMLFQVVASLNFGALGVGSAPWTPWGGTVPWDPWGYPKAPGWLATGKPG